MATNPTAPSVFDLSPAEKLQLVQDLWDDLATNPDDIPLPEWQKAELDRRIENFKKFSVPAVEWEEVKRRIRARHGR